MTVLPETESYAESCNVSIVSENLDAIEMTAPVEPSKSENLPRRSAA